MLDYIINESQPIYEMSMTAKTMKDKYAEVINAIVENLIAICLYPDNPTVHHWKERVCALCRRFINMDLKFRNDYNNRLKVLMSGVYIELNEDYSTLRNRIKGIKVYYSNRPNLKDRIVPYKPIEIVYEENRDRLISAIEEITKCVAAQDHDELEDYIDKF